MSIHAFRLGVSYAELCWRAELAWLDEGILDENVLLNEHRHSRPPELLLRAFEELEAAADQLVHHLIAQHRELADECIAAARTLRREYERHFADAPRHELMVLRNSDPEVCAGWQMLGIHPWTNLPWKPLEVAITDLVHFLPPDVKAVFNIGTVLSHAWPPGPPGRPLLVDVTTPPWRDWSLRWPWFIESWVAPLLRQLYVTLTNAMPAAETIKADISRTAYGNAVPDGLDLDNWAYDRLVHLFNETQALLTTAQQAAAIRSQNHPASTPTSWKRCSRQYRTLEAAADLAVLQLPSGTAA
jgi:hypothetical protein